MLPFKTEQFYITKYEIIDLQDNYFCLLDQPENLDQPDHQEYKDKFANSGKQVYLTELVFLI